MCSKLPSCQLIAWVPLCGRSSVRVKQVCPTVCISFNSFQNITIHKISFNCCVVSSNPSTVSPLYFYISLWLISALREPLNSLVYLCMNQWYMATVFLTIVFVGPRCVFNKWGEKMMYFEVKRNKVKRTRGVKRCVGVILWFDVQKYRPLSNPVELVCQQKRRSCTSCPQLWPRCGFPYGCVLLAVPSPSTTKAIWSHPFYCFIAFPLPPFSSPSPSFFVSSYCPPPQPTLHHCEFSLSSSIFLSLHPFRGESTTDFLSHLQCCWIMQ